MEVQLLEVQLQLEVQLLEVQLLEVQLLFRRGNYKKNSGGKFNCWKLNFEIPLRLHVNVVDSLRLHVNVMDFKSVLRITCNIFHYAFPLREFFHEKI